MSLDPILTAAHELERFCASQGWRFCFIGGIAVQRWGEPRFTADADLTLLTGFGREESYVDPLCAEFRKRREDAREFALRHRVLLLEADNGIPLDVALGAVPFEEKSVDRASPFLVGEGCTITTCSAEDLLVHKVVASREKDWLDIEGILARQWGRLDLKQFESEARPLLELKEDAGAWLRFQALRAKLQRELD